MRRAKDGLSVESDVYISTEELLAVILRRGANRSKMMGKMVAKWQVAWQAPSKAWPDAEVHHQLACNEGEEGPESLCRAICNPSRGCGNAADERLSSRTPDSEAFGHRTAPSRR